MSIVVDASVAIKWVLDEPGSDDAEALLTQSLVAPRIFAAECGNVLWKTLRRGEISEAEAQSKLADLTRVGVELRDVDVREALRLAVVLDHPIYDCLYLSLSRALGARLATADARWVRKLRSAGLAEGVDLVGHAGG